MTLTIPSVSLSGDTTVTTSGTGQSPPSGFKLGTPPTYYEIASTATFNGSVVVPPTPTLPHKVGGSGENGRDAEVEVSSLRTVLALSEAKTVQALPSGTTSPRNDMVKEEYSERPAATTGVVALHTLYNPGPSSFSVSIEDDKGNIILVSRVEDTESKAAKSSDLKVTEESDKVVFTWQGISGVKGFILHRTEKGKDNYTPVSNLIPYFGRDDNDVFIYQFTDNSVKPGAKYDYRLERVEADHKPDLKIGKLVD